MTAGERDHIFVLVDGELFHLFREIPQANDIGLPRQHFFFDVQEHFRDGFARQAAAAKADKVIAAENIQYRCAVIHRVTLYRQRVLLRLIAAQYEEQVVAVLLVQILPCGVVHRQMIGRHHDNGIFKPRRCFDFIDKFGNVFLAAADRAERLVGLPVDVITFTVAATGDKSIRMMGIHGQGKQ